MAGTFPPARSSVPVQSDSGDPERLASMVDALAQLSGVASEVWASRAAGAVQQHTRVALTGVAVLRVDPDRTDRVAHAELLGVSGLSTHGREALLAALQRLPLDPALITQRSLTIDETTMGVLAPLRGEVTSVSYAVVPASKEAASTRRLAVVLASTHDQHLPDASALVFARAATVPLARIVRNFTEPDLVLVTPREQDVLDLLSQGYSVREIGEALGRSQHTIHDYVKSLHRKLGAESRGGLVALALGRPALAKPVATSGIESKPAISKPAQPKPPLKTVPASSKL